SFSAAISPARRRTATNGADATQLPEDLEFSRAAPRRRGPTVSGRAESSSFARFTAARRTSQSCDTKLRSGALGQPVNSNWRRLGRRQWRRFWHFSSKDFGGRTSAEIHTTLTPRGVTSEATRWRRRRNQRLCDQPQVELPATPPATTAATSTAMEVELPRDVTAELPQAAGLPGDRRLRWNMDHGDELMKPLTLPPPTKGPRALALSTVDAAGLLLRPSRQPMSDKLLRVWSINERRVLTMCRLNCLIMSCPDCPLAADPVPALGPQHSGQNLPRISEERVQVPTVIQSEAVPPEAEQPQQPPEPEPQQQQQPASMMTPPAQQPARLPAFEDFFLQPPPPPEEVFASFVAERPPLSQDQELLMEGIRRSQQQQADSGSEIGDDYRPFASLCRPMALQRKRLPELLPACLSWPNSVEFILRQKQPYSEIFVKAIED
uniref:Rad21_Rec8 domain-containing protein n=1 Tax=Macrostomum lignano TaxID=282301 RepID=A0A1I8FJ96_9PLAT